MIVINCMLDTIVFLQARAGKPCLILKNKSTMRNSHVYPRFTWKGILTTGIDLDLREHALLMEKSWRFPNTKPSWGRNVKRWEVYGECYFLFCPSFSFFFAPLSLSLSFSLSLFSLSPSLFVLLLCRLPLILWHLSNTCLWLFQKLQVFRRWHWILPSRSRSTSSTRFQGFGFWIRSWWWWRCWWWSHGNYHGSRFT